MNSTEQRVFIYLVVAVFTAACAPIVGAGASLWTFVQIVAVTELIHWIGKPATDIALRA